MKFQVLLSSVADVKDFVDAASACPSEVDVLSGRYVVNGKSIMGLFSVDLSAPVTVAVPWARAGGRGVSGAGVPLCLPMTNERTRSSVPEDAGASSAIFYADSAHFSFTFPAGDDILYHT